MQLQRLNLNRSAMCAAKMTAHDTQITLSPDFGYYVLRKNGLKRLHENIVYCPI